MWGVVWLPSHVHGRAVVHAGSQVGANPKLTASAMLGPWLKHVSQLT